MHYARKGEITPEVAFVAAREGLEPEFVRSEVGQWVLQLYLPMARLKSHLWCEVAVHTTVHHFGAVRVNGEANDDYLWACVGTLILHCCWQGWLAHTGWNTWFNDKKNL